MLFSKRVPELIGSIKRHRTEILIVILMAAFFYSLRSIQLLPDATDTFGIQEREFACLDFLKSGTLYGGQPYCIQGPMLYLTMLLADTLLSLQNMILIISLIHAVTIMLLYKIVKKETGKSWFAYFLLVFFMYMFLIYDLLAFADLPTELALVFVTAGTYCLYYMKGKSTDILAGMFFALAVFSKLTAVFPCSIVILFYLFRSGFFKFSGHRPGIALSRWKCLRIFLPIAIVAVLFILAFPHMLTYIYFAPQAGGVANPASYHPPPGAPRIGYVASALYSIQYLTYLKLEPSDIAIKFIYLFSAAALIIVLLIKTGILRKQHATSPGRQGNHFSIAMMSSVVVIALAILFITTGAVYGTGQITWIRYIATVIIFFIPLSIVSINAMNNKKIRIAAVIAVIALFVLLGISSKTVRDISNIQYKEDALKLDSLIEGIYPLVPHQDGMLLLGNRRIAEEYFSQYGNQSVIFKYKMMPDIDYSPGLEAVGAANRTAFDIEVFGNISKEVDNGTFSLIEYGPFTPDENYLGFLLNHYNKIALANDYCAFILPVQEHRQYNSNHFTALFLRDKSQCDQMQSLLLDYYRSNLGKICELDSGSANMIKFVLSNDGINETRLPRCGDSKDALLKAFGS